MKAYELLFFVDPSLDPETRLAVMKRTELDRVLRITDAVVRHMIVRRDDQE